MQNRSLYQLTKNSIEQGILQLQQKIRRRKELQFERQIDENLIRSQKLYQYERELGDLQRVYEQAKYDELRSLSYTNYIEPQYSDSLKYDPLSLTVDQIKQKIRRETLELQYLRKLQKMKSENMYLEDRFSSISKSLQQTMIRNSSHIRQPIIYGGYNNSPIKLVKENSPYNICQYDEPIEEDSSVLVEKYSRGLKAQQYYEEIKRLQKLQQKFRAMVFHKGLSIMNKNSYQTPQQLRSSPRKRSIERTIEKNPIPIIKQDIQEGVQTVVNSANRNKSIDILSPPKQTSQFINKKLQKVISFQKGQSQIRKQNIKKTANEHHLKSQRKSSSRGKMNKSKLAQTIDLSSLNKTYSSPIKRIRSNSKQNYKNPYLFPYSKPSTKRSTSKKSKTKHQSLHHHTGKQFPPTQLSHSQIHSIPNNSTQICIPAPHFPASQTIDYSQTYMDKIKSFCNEKIENRLRISTIVYKDSKMRNLKHQMDHLLSKYENEIKARKEIKDKINTNPRILKKHKMVVQ